jgi:hypothetical protein
MGFVGGWRMAINGGQIVALSPVPLWTHAKSRPANFITRGVEQFASNGDELVDYIYILYQSIIRWIAMQEFGMSLSE